MTREQYNRAVDINLDILEAWNDWDKTIIGGTVEPQMDVEIQFSIGSVRAHLTGEMEFGLSAGPKMCFDQLTICIDQLTLALNESRNF